MKDSDLISNFISRRSSIEIQDLSEKLDSSLGSIKYETGKNENSDIYKVTSNLHYTPHLNESDFQTPFKQQPEEDENDGQLLKSVKYYGTDSKVTNHLMGLSSPFMMDSSVKYNYSEMKNSNKIATKNLGNC